MKNLFLRRSAITVVIMLGTLLTSACAVTGGGYGYGYDDNVSIGIGLDYYEPYGMEYGGWGPGYRVGPSHGGDRRPDAGGGHAAPHAYRSAPASHAIPSLPSHSRAGGTQSRSRDSRQH